MFSCVEFLPLEIKVIFSVLVADAANYLFERLVVGGILTVLNPLADEVAENSSEILVAGI